MDVITYLFHPEENAITWVRVRLWMGHVVDKKKKKKDSRAFNIQWMGDKFPITQRLWFVLFFCLFIFPGLSKRSLSWLYMCMSSDDSVLSIHDLFISLNAVDVLLITTDHCLLLFMWPWPADKSRAEGWEGCYSAGMVFSVTCWLCFWVMDGQ